MRQKVTGNELDVGEMTQAGEGEEGGSIAAGKKAGLEIQIYELTASHVPDPMNMVQIH